MKVKTFKRMSKRFISSLLSVIMVLSLFTVCMVGSTITAGAYNINSSTKIIVDISNTDWSQVYLYIGSGNHTSVYSMTTSEGAGKYSLTLSSYNNYDGFFFADANYNIASDKSITDAYNSISATSRSLNLNGNGNSITNADLQSQYNGETIKITIVNTTMTADISKTGWKNNSDSNGDGVLDTLKVYLYVGSSSKVEKYLMTQVVDTTKYTAKVTTTDYTGYFFSFQDKETTGTNLYDLYNSIGNQDKSMSGSGKLKPFSGTSIPEDTVIVEVSDIVSTGIYYLDATLYKYRNTQQVANAVANSSTKTDYTIDTSNSMDGSEKDGHMYKEYNKAVAKWFGGENWSKNKDETTTSYTPLYEGNFHDLNKNSSFPKSLYHWVRVANAANRYDNPGKKAEDDYENTSDDAIRSADNIKSSAQNLVDKTMSDLNNTKEGTITQHGVELPQFSDTFTNNNPTLQSKYSNLKFEVIANKKTSGNIWYSYDSSSDGNRLLNVGTGKLESSASLGGYYPLGDNMNSHGTRFDVSFVMPANGTGRLNDEDLQFTFTGDDDLWVYIDGYLALDLGGSHAKAEGSINLRTKEATIKTGVYNADYNSVTNKTAPGTAYNDGGTNTSDGKLADITQPFPSGLTESLKDTTKEHTMTIFYMERGQYDSNLSFKFFLPQTNFLKIEQKLDTANVNSGLLKETLNTADKDVHEVVLKSNSKDASSNDTAVIPVVGDLKRVDADGAYTLLQPGKELEEDATAPTGVPFDNTTNNAGGTMVTAGETTFVWEDSNTSFDNSKKSFGIGTGVVGDNGGVDLLYNQSATFNDQFTLGSKFQLIPQTNLKRFGVNTAEKLYNPPPAIDSLRTEKEARKYYDQTVTVTDSHGNDLVADTSGSYNFGSTNDINAKITAIYTNAVKTGTVKFKKALVKDESEDSTTIFKFSIEFAHIFGGNDTDAFDEYPIKYRVLDSNGTYSEEKTYDSSTGIALKIDETAIIDGIPIDTQYRIIEEGHNSTTKPYSVASVTEDTSSTPGAFKDSESTKGGIVAAVGTVADDKENVANLNFNNTTKTTQVWYRFKDRQITTGLPTKMETHYTYFTRDIPGGALTGTAADKNTIEKYAPTIKNLMKTYSLKDENGNLDIKFNYVLTDKDLENAEGKRDLSVGDPVILATYTEVDRMYNLNFTYPDASGNYSSKSLDFPFNGLVELGTIKAPATYTDAKGTHNFKYWAKLVNIDGSRAVTYTPVSTNYSYSYRVTDDAVLRAVYDNDADYKQLEPPVVVKDNKDYYVSGKGTGYDASAAERVYDSYSKDVSVTNEGVTTITSQDRTRINVVFGAVGSKDIDKRIEEVGYILLQNTGKYATDNLFTDEALREIAKTAQTTVTTPMVTGEDNNEYQARIKSYTVEGNGYIWNDTTKEWKDVYKPGIINLTNKNRVNIVFDMKNDSSKLDDYYTCYTFMKRSDYQYNSDGTIKTDADGKPMIDYYYYVSDTPAYFNLREAEPYIQDVEDNVDTYPVLSYVKDEAGNINNSLGNVTLSKSYIKDGQKLTLTITPTHQTVGNELTASVLKSLKIGALEITDDKFESYTISKTGTSVYSIIFDKATHLPELSTLEVVATFSAEKDNKDILVDVSKENITNGKLEISADNITFGTSALVKKGSSFYVRAIPNDNYLFTNWKENNSSKNLYEVKVAENGTYTLPTPVFGECVVVSGKSYDSGVLKVSTNPSNGFDSSVKVLEGGKFYVKFVPNADYLFTKWNDNSTDNPTTVVVDKDGNYTLPTPVATKCIVVNGKTYDGGLVEVSTSQNTGFTSSVKVLSGDIIYVKATPALNYKFTGWTGNATGTTNPIAIKVDANGTIPTPIFVECLTIQGESHTGGSVLVSTTQNDTFDSSITVDKGVATTIYAKAVPDANYKFTGWTDSALGTTNPIEVAVSADGEYKLPTPTFVECVDVTVGSYVGGTVQVSTSKSGTYSSSVKVEKGGTFYAKVTANPNFRFKQWDNSSTETTISLTVGADGSYNIPKPAFTVKVQGESHTGGSVQVSTSQSSGFTSSDIYVDIGGTFYAKAVYSSGYEFKGWKSGATGTTNPVAVTVNADGTYTLPTPEFKLKGVLVTFKANISGWGGVGYNTSEVKIKYKNSSSQWVYATMTYDQSQSNPSSNLYVFTVLLTDLATGNDVGFNMLRVAGDDQMGANAWIGANHNNNETQYTIVRATDGSLSISQS
ncbi:MAG: hypothetical protein UHY68_04570 [Acutalibacteraceae bacterium]|nr:hypothetical protein [Acutalibacteraceae bacterium]